MSSPSEQLYSAEERAAEKQASRDADARALASGNKSGEQLAEENGLLWGVDARIDFSEIRSPK